MECIRFERRPDGRAVADFSIPLWNGIRMEVRDFVIYERDGGSYLNPPTKRHNNSRFFSVLRIPDRTERTRFSDAAFAAIERFRHPDEFKIVAFGPGIGSAASL
jgi:hypothetical protein